jgi:hypothetical protein
MKCWIKWKEKPPHSLYFIVAAWIAVAHLLCSIQSENTQIDVQRTRGKAWEVREVQCKVLDVQIGRGIPPKDMRILNGANEEVPPTGSPHKHFPTLASCWACYSISSVPWRWTDLASTASGMGIGTGQLLVISQVCCVRGLPENDSEGKTGGAAGSGPGGFRIERRSQHWT